MSLRWSRLVALPLVYARSWRSGPLRKRRMDSATTAHCPRGHRLGAGHALVGHQPCSCAGGHTSWTWLECGATVYAPPISGECLVLHGAAACGRGISSPKA